MAHTKGVLAALQAREAWLQKQPQDQPLFPGGPLPSDYLSGMLRKPGMGSYVTKIDGSTIDTLNDLKELFGAIDWDLTPVPTGTGELILSGRLPESYRGYDAVLLLHEIPDKELSMVRVRKGLHGLELITEAISPVPVNTVVALLNADGLVTWFPGRVTPKVNIGLATVKLSG